jgi:hypothetical protein
MIARARSKTTFSLFFGTMLGVATAAFTGHAQEAKDLRPEYKIGYTYQFEQKQSMDMVMTIPGAGEIEQKVATEMGMSAVATKRKDDKAGVRVTTSINSIKYSTENPAAGGNISYDSTNPVDKNSALAVQFEPMMEKDLVIIYDGEGKVEKFEGFEEFMEAAGAGAQMFSEEQFAQMADPTAMLGLDGAKKIGDKWSAEPVVEMGEMGTIKMPMELHYSKDETADGNECARIDTVGTAEMKMNIPGAPEDNGGGGITTKDSIVEGYYLIDPKAGMLRDSVIKMDLTMSINAGGQEMTIPLKQVVHYKLISMEKTK